jgi:hypothetical protein
LRVPRPHRLDGPRGLTAPPGDPVKWEVEEVEEVE